MFFFVPLLHFRLKAVSLHRVFHSIRFKVNKVGIQRYPFFYALRRSLSGSLLISKSENQFPDLLLRSPFTIFAT